MLLHVFLLQNVLTAQQHKMSMSPQVIHAIPSPGTPVYDYGRKRYPAEIVIETEYGEVYVLLCLVMTEVIWHKEVLCFRLPNLFFFSPDSKIFKHI